jgi:hypothetical protein
MAAASEEEVERASSSLEEVAAAMVLSLSNVIKVFSLVPQTL